MQHVSSLLVRRRQRAAPMPCVVSGDCSQLTNSSGITAGRRNQHGAGARHQCAVPPRDLTLPFYSIETDQCILEEVARCPRCQQRLPVDGECTIHGVATQITDVPDIELEVAAPAGWRLGEQIASGGSSVVYSVHRDGVRPAVMKLGRW